MQVDVAVIGAGPAGLCFARSLAGSGLSVALVEPQSRQALAEAAFDGREIALTHASRTLLDQLGIWERIDPAEISPLCEARVMNGPSPFAMVVADGGHSPRDLGWLVPNHLIRRAAHAATEGQAGLHWFDGASVRGLSTDAEGAHLQLSDGRTLEARLAVSADSRFSGTRRMMGIGARMRDFGKTMLVCRMAHEQAHHHAAWEWFGYGQTLALLPLNGHVAGAVLTLPQHEVDKLLALDEAGFSEDITRRFDGRLGAMRQVGTRHAYPLVATWARRFVGRRYALIGDAAVGMHPVTAHGFNLGVQSQWRLATAVLDAHRNGRDIADDAVLAAYERAHRRAAEPVYLATQLVVGLYTDDRTPARWLRDATLRVADRVAPFKRLLAAQLVQPDPAAGDGPLAGLRALMGRAA